MKIQLLPSTIDERGCATAQQHLPCFLIDDCAAVDAGSLALALSDAQRTSVRDIVITHPHLDHIATLPIFIDDLFADLRAPVCIHAAEETITTLEEHIFNWKVFPRFSELTNDYGAVMQYSPVQLNQEFAIKHLRLTPVAVSHQIPTIGLIIADKLKTVAFTSDTAATTVFWEFVNNLPGLDALFVECAFPDSKAELAAVSHHLTPQSLRAELAKFKHDCPIFAINLKPMYRTEIVAALRDLNIANLDIMQVGKIYEF